MRGLALVVLLAISGCKKKPAEEGGVPSPVTVDRDRDRDRDRVRVAVDAAAEPASPDDLVDPTELDPSIALDMRYATDRNFVGEPVYPVARCLLRRAVAERLVAASKAVRDQGFRLELWDCYRPFSVQETFWAKVPDPRYVARPVREGGVPRRGSKHNRGAAVDLALIAADGSAVELPTDHDDFSPRAHRGGAWSKAAQRHAEILDRAMTAAGFTGIPTEWWHYDGPDWKRYPLSDEPLGKL